MDADDTIGQRIRSRRIDRGLTRAALAEQLGSSQQQVAAWEQDRAVPGADDAAALAKALGTSISQLGGSEPPSEWSDLPTEALVVSGIGELQPAQLRPSPAGLDEPPVPPRLIDEPTLAVPEGRSDTGDEIGRFPVIRRVIPPSLRRGVAGPDYRETERRTYWMRFTLLAIALFVLFVVFVWATGEFLQALSDAFGTLSDTSVPSTAVPPRISAGP